VADGHGLEQIIATLRMADAMLAADKTVAQVVQALDVNSQLTRFTPTLAVDMLRGGMSVCV
jgi:hypothetical protein